MNFCLIFEIFPIYFQTVKNLAYSYKSVCAPKTEFMCPVFLLFRFKSTKLSNQKLFLY